MKSAHELMEERKEREKRWVTFVCCGYEAKINDIMKDFEQNGFDRKFDEQMKAYVTRVSQVLVGCTSYNETQVNEIIAKAMNDVSKELSLAGWFFGLNEEQLYVLEIKAEDTPAEI